MGSYRRRSAATEFDHKLAAAMQDYFHAFILDPTDGLKNKGWLPHSGSVEDGGFMLRFAQGDAISVNISSLAVDGKCLGKGEYDSFPK